MKTTTIRFLASAAAAALIWIGTIAGTVHGQTPADSPSDKEAGGQVPTADTETDPVMRGSEDLQPVPETFYEEEPIGGGIAEEYMTVDDGLEMPDLYSSGSWFQNGCVYGNLDFVMLTKSQPRPVRLALDYANTAEFKTGSVSFDFEPGTRVTIGRRLGTDDKDRVNAIEFTYMGSFDWAASDYRAAFSLGDPDTGSVGSLNSMLGNQGLPIAGFDDADRQWYDYSGTLNSYELNFRVQTRPGRDQVFMQPDGTWVRKDKPNKNRAFYGGFRAITMKEDILYQSVSTVPEQSGRYNCWTENDMFGVQLGLQLGERHTQWHWGLRGELGGLTNFAERKSQISTVGGIDSQYQTIHDTNLVFMGHGGFVVGYQMRPNIAFSAAYDFYYMTGVALAGENLGYDGFDFARFNVGGDQLFHGGSLGLELDW